MNHELAPEILISAYAQGVFPMAGPDNRIRWYSPDPRAILPLDAFHLSANLRRRCQQERFQIRLNSDFVAVLRACADRKDGTWINQDIIEAYTLLHRMGLAHSVESWQADTLVGGLYGVALGGAFFGESMFHHATDASKVALVHLVDRMRERGYQLLDVQFTTPHLQTFGTVEIPRREYLRRLRAAIRLDRRFTD
jgi:leucyl/phenylalanyl-tRNA---protein transferase